MTLSSPALLDALLADPRLTDGEREAFEDMLDVLSRHPDRALSDKQRAWCEKVAARLGLDGDDAANLWSSGAVPRGAEVEVPEVLRVLPLKPPSRRNV